MNVKELLNRLLGNREPVKAASVSEVKADNITETQKNDDDVAEPTDDVCCLLDSGAYMALAEQCCQMHEELDAMQMQVSDPVVRDYIVMQKSRIRESLLLSGASIIDEETEFNRLRHQSVPPSIVPNGTPIAETIEAGIEIENRVMIKSKVRI